MASGPLDLRGTVRIVDRASGPLRRVSGALGAIGKQSGVMAVGRAFSNAGGAVAAFGSQLSGLLVPLGGLLGLGAGFGLVAAIQGVASRIDEFTKMGRILGMTGQQMRELEFAANRQGAAWATVQSAMFAMSKRAGELKLKTGGLYSFLKKEDKGLLAQFQGAKNLEEQLALAAEAYRHFEKQGKGNAFLAAAFSRGGAVAMAKMFQGGVEGLRGLTNEARTYMGVATKKDRDNVEAYTDSLANMEGAWRGIALAVSRHVMPVLTPLINDLAEFFAGQKTLIGKTVGDWFRDLAQSARAVDWRGVYQGVVAAKDAFWQFSDSVGGLRNVLIGLGLVLAAPFLASIAQLVFAFGMLAKVIVASLGGPVALAVAAFAVSGWVIYREWAAVQANLASLFGELGRSARGFADIAIGALMLDWSRVQQGWSDGLGGLGSALYEAFRGHAIFLRGFLKLLDGWFGTDLAGIFDRAFAALPEAGQRAVDAVKRAFEMFLAWIKSTWVGQIASTLQGAFDGLKMPALPAMPVMPRGAPPPVQSGNRPGPPSTTGPAPRVVPQSYTGPVPRIVPQSYTAPTINLAPAIVPTAAPVPSAAGLLRNAGAYGGGETVVREERRATLDINVPAGVSARFDNSDSAQPMFDRVRLNRGPSMRGSEVAA